MKDEEGITDEHVALVTFGHDTRVVKRLTNHFEEVRASLGKMSGCLVTLSPPNLKMAFGTTFTFSIIPSLRKQRIESIKNIC